MIAPRILVVLLLLLSASAQAAPILFEAPEGTGSIPISIYPADSPTAAPVIQARVSEESELPPGDYVYGFDSYGFRSSAFTHAEGHGTRIELGAVRIIAPEGAAAEFTVFSDDKGRLLFPLGPGVTQALPPGDYHLRRDLAELTIPLKVAAGSVSDLPMGSIRLNVDSLSPGTPVFAAPQGHSVIAGVMAGDEVHLALPEGVYRLRSMGHDALEHVAVTAGAATAVALTWVRWASRADEASAVEMRAGAQIVDLRAGRTTETLFFQADEVEVRRHDVTAAKLQPDATGALTIWQRGDGQLANVAGLALAFQPDSPAVARAGASLALAVESAERALAQATAWQGNLLLAETELRLRTGWSDFELLMPEDLAPGEPVVIRVIAQVPGPSISGEMAEIAVHRRLSVAPGGIRITQSQPTLIGLAWDAPNEAGISGYRVFRGTATRPVPGGRLVRVPEFADIALSARQRYHYRICTVDQLDLLGPCAEIIAETPPAN